MSVQRYSQGLRLDRQGRGAYSEPSQPVFVPHGPYLFVSRKFATGGGGLRGRDCGAFFRRKRHRRCLIICSGKPENNTGDVILSVRRKITCGFKCSVEKFCHYLIVNPSCLKTTTIVTDVASQPDPFDLIECEAFLEGVGKMQGHVHGCRPVGLVVRGCIGSRPAPTFIMREKGRGQPP